MSEYKVSLNYTQHVSKVVTANSQEEAEQLTKQYIDELSTDNTFKVFYKEFDIVEIEEIK